MFHTCGDTYSRGSLRRDSQRSDRTQTESHAMVGRNKSGHAEELKDWLAD